MKLRLQRASSLSGVLLAKFSVSVSLAPSFKGRFLSSLIAGSARPRLSINSATLLRLSRRSQKNGRKLRLVRRTASLSSILFSLVSWVL
ncbi:hypothetical protein I315_01898 [Cryptococcus gattii Ru294]|nr:hypothetical protein I315_01898 [Cryptococcus gattii Ru294]